MILAASLGSIPMTYMMDPNDYRICKIVVYSRAVTNAVHLVGVLSGLYEPVRSANDENRRFTMESLLGVLATTFCCYAFVYEVHAMSEPLRQ